MVQRHITDAVEVIVGGAGKSPVLLSCEHASNRLPDGWAWPEADHWIRDTHWAWDPGAEDITRRVCGEIGAIGVLARFSRLLIDANRDHSSDTLFRDVAEGGPVHLNVDIDAADRDARIERYWTPYHETLDACLGEVQGNTLLSMHSFTPEYEGHKRELEIGVLFDDDEEPAVKLMESFAAHGFKVALNEPYSGRHGMMFSAYRHAAKHHRFALEIELRNDLATDPKHQRRITQAILAGLRGAELL